MNSTFGTLVTSLAASIGMTALGLATMDLNAGAVTQTHPRPPAQGLAQTSYYYAGQAASGEQILVDLNSIAAVGDNNTNFDYLLGDEQIASQAHCVGSGAWTTLSDGTVHYAQSQATRDMVRIVCSYSMQTAFNPDAFNPDIEPTPATESATGSPSEFNEPGADNASETLAEALPADPATPEIITDSAEEPGISIAVSPYEAPQPEVAQQPEERRLPYEAPRRRPETDNRLQTGNNEANALLQTALVYDPASNVRETPNGRILCSIETVIYINILGQRGDWYRTDACGRVGVIHISQISFE